MIPAISTNWPTAATPNPIIPIGQPPMLSPEAKGSTVLGALVCSRHNFSSGFQAGGVLTGREPHAAV